MALTGRAAFCATLFQLDQVGHERDHSVRATWCRMKVATRRVGFVDDLIVGGDTAVTYAIVNAGGFVGLAKHDVAVPVSVQTDGREVDPGRHNKGGSQGKSSVRVRQ